MDNVSGAAFDVLTRGTAGIPEEVSPEGVVSDETQAEGFFGTRYEGVLDAGCGLIGGPEVGRLSEDIEAGLGVGVGVWGGGWRHCGVAVWYGGGGGVVGGGSVGTHNSQVTTHDVRYPNPREPHIFI